MRFLDVVRPAGTFVLLQPPLPVLSIFPPFPCLCLPCIYPPAPTAVIFCCSLSIPPSSTPRQIPFFLFLSRGTSSPPCSRSFCPTFVTPACVFDGRPS